MPAAVSIVFGVTASAVAASVFRASGSAYAGSRGLFLRAVCSVLFTAAAAEFLLIVCEVLQAGNRDVRASLWKATTALLLALLVLVLPALQILRYFVVKHPRLKFMAVPVFALYLVLFRLASTQLPIERYVPDGSQRVASIEPGALGRGTTWFSMRQDSLACVSFIGITTMALLCGISSVSAPYTAFFGDKTPVSEVDSDSLRHSLRSIDEMISSKELEVSRLRLDIARSNTAGGVGGSDASGTLGSSMKKGSTFSLTRLVAGIVRKGDDRQAQLQSLLVEQNALARLRVEVEADLDNVLHKLSQQQYYATAKGRVHKLVFAIFAIYCIYRVCNSYLRVGWWFVTSQPQDNLKGGPRDALVLLIAATINQFFAESEIGVQGWSRIIGVLMSGAVFAAALNGVLQMARRIMRLLYKASKPPVSLQEGAPDAPPVKLSIPLDPLTVGQVVGVYVLSIATTLRFNLPRSMSGPIMAALVSPLKVTSVQLWNDMVLCVTSTLCILVLCAMSKLTSEPIYDDEMGELKKS